MSISLGDFLLKMGIDKADFDKAMADAAKSVTDAGKKIEKETTSWQSQFTAVGKVAVGMGASITAAMGIVLKSFTSVGSELHDLSLKTGVSAETLAGLKYAAEQSGASLSTIDMALKRSSVLLEEAKDSTTAAAKAFHTLGLSATDLQKLNPQDQFMTIMNALAGVTTQSTRAKLAVDLFGRSGTDMLPMLENGAQGLQAMIDKGISLTGWTDAGAKSADALGDAFGTLKTATQGVFNAIGEALAPALKSLVDMIVPLVKGFTDFTRAHPELAKQIGLVALALGGFLTVAGTFILLAPKIGAAFGAAMGPVGMVITLISALIAIGILVWQNWDKIAKFFGDAWDHIKIAFASGVKFIVNTVLMPFIEVFSKMVGGIAIAIGKLVGVFDKEKGAAIEAVGRKIMNARQSINDWTDSITNSANASLEARDKQYDLGEAAKKAGNDAKTAAGQYDTLTDSINKVSQAKAVTVETTVKITQLEKELQDAKTVLAGAKASGNQLQIPLAQDIVDNIQKQLSAVTATHAAAQATVLMTNADAAKKLAGALDLPTDAEKQQEGIQSAITQYMADTGVSYEEATQKVKELQQAYMDSAEFHETESQTIRDMMNSENISLDEAAARVRDYEQSWIDAGKSVKGLGKELDAYHQKMEEYFGQATQSLASTLTEPAYTSGLDATLTQYHQFLDKAAAAQAAGDTQQAADWGAAAAAINSQLAQRGINANNPGHAIGYLDNKPHLANISEGGKYEAVVPLNTDLSPDENGRSILSKLDLSKIFNMPELKLKLPEYRMPDLSHSFSMPSFRMPKFESAGPGQDRPIIVNVTNDSDIKLDGEKVGEYTAKKLGKKYLQSTQLGR
jgi:hypothetical protein